VKDQVAVVLAVTLGASLCALAGGAAYEIAAPSGHLSAQASGILSTALGALIGALSGYLGTSGPRRD
jgi:hypothetical protein